MERIDMFLAFGIGICLGAIIGFTRGAHSVSLICEHDVTDYIVICSVNNCDTFYLDCYGPDHAKDGGLSE
jgi:hypothetical protein